MCIGEEPQREDGEGEAPLALLRHAALEGDAAAARLAKRREQPVVVERGAAHDRLEREGQAARLCASAVADDAQPLLLEGGEADRVLEAEDALEADDVATPLDGRVGERRRRRRVGAKGARTLAATPPHLDERRRRLRGEAERRGEATRKPQQRQRGRLQVAHDERRERDLEHERARVAAARRSQQA